MKKIDWKKFDPPGMDTAKEEGLFAVGTFCSFLWSTLYFSNEFSDAYRHLWRGKTGKVLGGEAMEPFFELFGRSLSGYPMIMLCMFVTVWMRYSYYQQGSKSIYLMRRLPDSNLFHRTCWVIPMSRVGICALVCGLQLLLSFIAYVVITPDVCLPWNYGGML